MIDRERTLCVCNSLSLNDIVALIKEHDIRTMEALLETGEVGNKCESCIEEGFDNDGFSLAMALSLVKEGRI